MTVQVFAEKILTVARENIAKKYSLKGGVGEDDRFRELQPDEVPNEGYEASLKKSRLREIVAKYKATKKKPQKKAKNPERVVVQPQNLATASQTPRSSSSNMTPSQTPNRATPRVIWAVKRNVRSFVSIYILKFHVTKLQIFPVF
jgi:hypothetical protein